jgi:hypothetical protein
VDLPLLPAYLKAVLRQGWVLPFVLVGVVGDVATVVGDFAVPRWVWYALIAFGVLAAQFGAYCDVIAELATVRGRLRELDTPAARRAYVDEMLEESEAMQEAIASVTDEEWPMRARTFNMDTVHWENEVRAELRKSFGSEIALLFDSEEGLVTPEDLQHTVRSKGAESSYLARRSKRLTEIRKSL